MILGKNTLTGLRFPALNISPSQFLLCEFVSPRTIRWGKSWHSSESLLGGKKAVRWSEACVILHARTLCFTLLHFLYSLQLFVHLCISILLSSLSLSHPFTYLLPAQHACLLSPETFRNLALTCSQFWTVTNTMRSDKIHRHFASSCRRIQVREQNRKSISSKHLRFGYCHA